MPLPHLLSVPEMAITSFERAHGMRVTIHDLAGELAPFLAAGRMWHRLPACDTVKELGHDAACVAFDVDRVRADLASLPDGRVHVCHAGFVECVVPGFQRGVLAWVLFAGIRRPGRHLAMAAPAPVTTALTWARSARLPPTIDDGDAWVVLEGLRQLQARLRTWVDRHARAADGAGPAAAPGDRHLLRREIVLRAIAENHRQPFPLAALADGLGLSRGRACREVRRLFGVGFQQLLLRERVRTAEHLLRHTDEPLEQVARRSGFGDASMLYRAFRAAFGISPGRYRSIPKV
ncbi:MAG TPA: AraC family transcriptional regulator [Planctomycetota bacterium]|nr:AraC family transcriptional regulator [Planctomycetota bacterium]